jgi:hypothetical protein
MQLLTKPSGDLIIAGANPYKFLWNIPILNLQNNSTRFIYTGSR